MSKKENSYKSPRSDARHGAPPAAEAPLVHASVDSSGVSGAAGAASDTTPVRSSLHATYASPCEVWGVLNVTPDSFSDGGRFLDTEAAVEHGLALVRAGADVVDVGGESTRPRGATYGEGYVAVPPAEELARVLPVVRQLVAEGVRVSVDTVKPEVAEAVLAAGARYVNDVSMGRSERLLEACARHGASLVLMHNRGRGEVREPFTVYGDVVADVRSELMEAVARARGFGIAAERLWLDPGLGFAKTAAQSGQALAGVAALVATEHPVLVGASRKSFVGALTASGAGSIAPPTERLGGSIAAAIWAALEGARAVRVHDVAETRQALELMAALTPRSDASML